MKSFISHGVQNNIIKLNIDCTNERSKSIDYTGTEDLTIRLEKYGTLKKKLFKEAREHTISSNTDVVFRNKTKIDFVSCCKTKEGVDMNNQKKVNQDAYIEMKNVLHLDNFHIYGVLDGHGNNNNTDY